MQACMDSSADWLKGIVHEEIGMDSSSSPSTELIACSRPPVLERRLRPQHDQALQCPRCDSTHTKFCYYNNYSLSQPRYFCKTCRRYWTKGGSLRNVPVGGGCRKNKRPGNKKPSDRPPFNPNQPISCFQGSTTDLHLAFSGVHLPNYESLPGSPRNLNFMECKYNSLLGSSVGGLELMDSKFGGAPGSSRSNLFMGGSGIDMCLGVDANHGFASTGFHGFSQLGFPIDGSHGTLMEACQRLSLPFEGQEEDPSAIEVKPVDRILSLDWQEHGCAEVGRDSFGYSNGLGLWTGMINGHGPSAAI